MRILFYLPVVTPWWFDNIILPLIRAAARDADVHVLVPPLWRNTGVGSEQLTQASDLDHVHWYLLDGPDHPKLRISALDQPDLLALVHDIAPDLTLCRSADIATPALFPGMVRHIMECAVPPFVMPQHWCVLSSSLFDHGVMPEVTMAQTAWLDTALDAEWAMARASAAPVPRDIFLRRAGLPTDRKIIGLPLELEHEEIFFGPHNPHAGNIALINDLADALDTDSILAVTNHPLNERHSDNGPLYRAIAAHGGKVHLVRHNGLRGGATNHLARHADAMVIGNSKSISACAFFGTPVLRLSRFATGAWMRTYDALAPFITALREGTLAKPTQADAQRWFAYHIANNVLDPTEADLTSATLADHVHAPCNPARWEAGLARYRNHHAHRLAA